MALCNGIRKSYAKNEENLVLIFFIIFFSNPSFNLKFSAGLCNATEKSYAENKENLSVKFRNMETFLRKASQNLWDAYITAGLKGLYHTGWQVGYNYRTFNVLR